MEKPNDIVPMMTVGKYKGTRVDALPTSYCRWLLTQNFPEEILKYARRKVESNKTTDLPMEVTRHAYDSFSLRYMDIFVHRENKKEGFGSFVARMALEALEKGKDITVNRHRDENTRISYEGITWVFNRDGELKTLITVLEK